MSAMDLSDQEDNEDDMEEWINKNSRPVAPHPPRNINAQVPIPESLGILEVQMPEL